MHPWLQHSWKRASLRSKLTFNLHVVPMMRRAKQEGEIMSLHHAWCQEDVDFLQHRSQEVETYDDDSI